MVNNNWLKAMANEPDPVLESLADLEHKRWSRWQSYLHSKCTENPDGSLTIPVDLVRRWERQIATDYSELSDKEKDSDRKEAQNTLDLLNNGRYS